MRLIAMGGLRVPILRAIAADQRFRRETAAFILPRVVSRPSVPREAP